MSEFKPHRRASKGKGTTEFKWGQSKRRRTKEAILKRDGPKCGICLNVIDLSIPAPFPQCWTLDHVVPRIRGGSDDMANLCGAHKACNEWKGQKLMSELDFTKCPMYL